MKKELSSKRGKENKKGKEEGRGEAHVFRSVSAQLSSQNIEGLGTRTASSRAAWAIEGDIGLREKVSILEKRFQGFILSIFILLLKIVLSQKRVLTCIKELIHKRNKQTRKLQGSGPDTREHIS